MNGIDDLAGKKFRFRRPIHLAKRRNNSACSTDVFRISFFAFSRDMARGWGAGGGTLRTGAFGSVAATIFVCFSTERLILYIVAGNLFRRTYALSLGMERATLATIG